MQLGCTKSSNGTSAAGPKRQNTHLLAVARDALQAHATLRLEAAQQE
jgi:hypothetical protein